MKFKNSPTKLLIATDILARGIDIHSINLVINFNIPHNMYTYKHRIGRTGRFGRLGIVINFVTGFNDKRLIFNHSKDYDQQIIELPSLDVINNLLTTGSSDDCKPFISEILTVSNCIDDFEF